MLVTSALAVIAGGLLVSGFDQKLAVAQPPAAVNKLTESPPDTASPSNTAAEATEKVGRDAGGRSGGADVDADAKANSGDEKSSTRPGGKPPLTPEQKAKAASARAGAQLLVAVLLLFLLTVMFVCLYGYVLRRRLRRNTPGSSAPRDELWYLKPQKKGTEPPASSAMPEPRSPGKPGSPKSSGTTGNPLDISLDDSADESLTSVGSSDQTAFGQPPAPDRPSSPPDDDGPADSNPDENNPDENGPGDGDRGNRNDAGPGSGKPSK